MHPHVTCMHQPQVSDYVERELMTHRILNHAHIIKFRGRQSPSSARVVVSRMPAQRRFSQSTTWLWCSSMQTVATCTIM